jgi:RNA 2',3'-cyclic 3'-phosphodiesterase
MKEQTIRAFYAIALDLPIKHLIYSQIEEIKRTCNLSVRWVKESQLHLTLRFLGNITDKQLENLTTSPNLLSEISPFNLVFEKLITFPKHKPRIIGISIYVSLILDELISRLEYYLNSQGFEHEDRAFLPHITLGRVVKPKHRYLDFGELKAFPKQFVDHVGLYKSELTPDGSVYTLLRSYPLDARP